MKAKKTKKISEREALRRLIKLGGNKVKSFSLGSLTVNCSSKGCNGKVSLLDVVGFPSASANLLGRGLAEEMTVVFLCRKCRRLHEHDGSPFKCGRFNKVYLDANGGAVVKNSRGKIVHTFWTSRSKPQKGPKTLICR